MGMAEEIFETTRSFSYEAKKTELAINLIKEIDKNMAGCLCSSKKDLHIFVSKGLKVTY